MGTVEMGIKGLEPFGVNMTDSQNVERLPVEEGPAFPVTNPKHIIHCGQAIDEVGHAVQLFSLDNQARIAQIQAQFSGDQRPDKVDLPVELLVQLYSLEAPELADAQDNLYMVLNEELRTDTTNIKVYGNLIVTVASMLAGRANFDGGVMKNVSQVRATMEQQGQRVAAYKEIIKQALRPAVDENMRDRLVRWAQHAEVGHRPTSRVLGIDREPTRREGFYGSFRRDLAIVDQYRLEVARDLHQAGIEHGAVVSLTEELNKTNAAEEVI